MGIKIAGKQGKYGIIRHNTSNSAATAFKALGTTANQWTNPVLVATNFRRILFNALSPVVDPAVTVDNYNTTSQLGLGKETTNFFVDKDSGLKKFNFSAIADLNTIAPLLVMALQGVVEAETGDNFTKTITDGFKTGVIDFNAGGGYTFGLCEKIGASADDGTLLQNGIMDSLNLVFDFNGKGVGRLAQVNGTMVFKTLAFDQTLTGTFVDTVLTPLDNTDKISVGDFTVDSVDYASECIRRIEIGIKLNVASNCSTVSGQPNQYDCMPEVTCNIVIDHTLVSEKIRGDFKDGSTIILTLTTTTALNTVGHFSLSLPALKMTADPFAYNGDYYGYNLQCEAYQSTTVSRVTFYVTDGLDWAF